MDKDVCQQTRRELVAINAVDPKSGKRCCVYISTKHSKSPGWRAYCKVPAYSYTADGVKRPPLPGHVFMVCVNVDRIAFHWTWVKCDPRDRECPIGYDTRFKEPIL